MTSGITNRKKCRLRSLEGVFGALVIRAALERTWGIPRYLRLLTQAEVGRLNLHLRRDTTYMLQYAIMCVLFVNPFSMTFVYRARYTRTQVSKTRLYLPHTQVMAVISRA